MKKNKKRRMPTLPTCPSDLRVVSRRILRPSIRVRVRVRRILRPSIRVRGLGTYRLRGLGA